MIESILLGILFGFLLSQLIGFILAIFQEDSIILTRNQTEKLVDFIVKLNREDSKNILDIIK